MCWKRLRFDSYRQKQAVFSFEGSTAPVAKHNLLRAASAFPVERYVTVCGTLPVMPVVESKEAF